MATQNTINKKTQDLTVDPGASSDSFVQFDINATGEFRIGVDDDDSDSFKLSQGSALGTNDTFVMTSSGQRSLPLQPAFSAYLSAAATNVTGDNTVYSVICDTEIFDIGSNYNNATGSFVAPITGRYVLCANIQLVNDTSTGGNEFSCTLVTSNRSYNAIFLPTYRKVTGWAGPNGSIAMPFSVLADMDASDTAYITIACNNGSKTDDIYGGNCYTWFQGYLAV